MTLITILEIAGLIWIVVSLVRAGRPSPPGGGHPAGTRPVSPIGDHRAHRDDDVDVEDFVLHDEINPDDEHDVGAPP